MTAKHIHLETLYNKTLPIKAIFPPPVLKPNPGTEITTLLCANEISTIFLTMLHRIAIYICLVTFSKNKLPKKAIVSPPRCFKTNPGDGYHYSPVCK